MFPRMRLQLVNGPLFPGLVNQETAWCFTEKLYMDQMEMNPDMFGDEFYPQDGLEKTQELLPDHGMSPHQPKGVFKTELIPPILKNFLLYGAATRAQSQMSNCNINRTKLLTYKTADKSTKKRDAYLYSIYSMKLYLL